MSFWDQIKNNITKPIQQAKSTIGNWFGTAKNEVSAFENQASSRISEIMKPIEKLTETYDFPIPGQDDKTYKPFKNLWIETGAQAIGLGARESAFPSATVGAFKGAGTGLGKAATFGWWDPKVKYSNEIEAEAGRMTDMEFNILGTIATFLFGGEVVQGVAKGIPAMAKIASIAPKTYSLLTNGLTFAGLNQLQKSEVQRTTSERAKDFGTDFALGGIFSIAGMKPNYFKSSAIIAPTTYVSSLIKGDSQEDALKNTAMVMALHTTNYAIARSLPGGNAKLESNMEKAAEEQLKVTRSEAMKYLGVQDGSTPDQINKAWKSKVMNITKQYPPQALQTPQEAARFNQAWNTANRSYEFLSKVQNPVAYTDKTFGQEFKDLYNELWVKVPDKRALILRTIRDIPAGLSIKMVLNDEQRSHIVKSLGGTETQTKYGKAGTLDDHSLMSLAHENNIEIPKTKLEQPVPGSNENVPTTVAPPTENTKKVYYLPDELMPKRGKPTWKHSKLLWNTMRNQFSQTNRFGRDVTANKGVVSWIIDTLENGDESTRNLVQEAKKYQGQRIDNKQYKKLYAMFKSRDYNMEGYKKVMATLKDIKPATITTKEEATPPVIQETPAENPIVARTEIPEAPMELSDETYKHGTPFSEKILKEGFSLEKAGSTSKYGGIMGKGIYLDTKPDGELAASYGKVIDVKIKKNLNLYHWDGKIDDFYIRETGYGDPEKITQYLQEKGYDGVIGIGQAVIFDPKNVIPVKENKTSEVATSNSQAENLSQPAILYHGTTEQNIDFLKVGNEGNLGKGIYLTDSESMAQYYGDQASHRKAALNGNFTGKVEKGNVLTVEVKPGTKIKKLDYQPSYDQAKAIREQGYEGIDYPDESGANPDMSPNTRYKAHTRATVIFNEDAVVIKKAQPVADPKETKTKTRNWRKNRFTKKETRAARADAIRQEHKPTEEKILDKVEGMSSVGEIMKSKRFQKRLQGKEKASRQMRLDEAKTPPPGQPPRPPQETQVEESPPSPKGSALEQIDAMVGKQNKKNGIKEFVKNAPGKFNRMFTDRFIALKKFEKDISKLQGEPIDIDSSPYIAARLYAGRFGTVEANFHDLQKIIAPLRKNRADFTRYLLAQRAIERGERGFDNPAGVTKETAETALVELKVKVGEKTYKQFEQIGQGIQNWSIKSILQPMRDTGVISMKAYESIVEKNKHWLPFHVLDYLPDAEQADKMEAGGETFSVNSQGVVKGLKGTEKQVRDPFESIIDNLSKAISVTKRNEVARKFIELRNSHPEAKEFIKYLAKGAKPPKDWEKINVFINGKVTKWAVPKDLGEAMYAMNPVQAGILGKLVLLSNKAFRAGTTTLYVPFTLSNAIRDYQTATIVNKWGFNPTVWLGGFKEGLKGAFKWESQAYDDFMRNQGGFGGYMENARQLSVASKQLFAPSWWEKTKAIINPFSLINNFAEAIELAPRLGIYKKGIKAGASITEAAFEARNATVDFAKAGTEARIINQWIPFVNARWQGLLRIGDAFKQNPFKTALKAIAMIVLPGIATYFYNILNHEDLWDDIPQWAKDQYFIIILGEEIDEKGRRVPKVLQIPKGDMGAIFFNPIQYALEYTRKQEPTNIFKLGMEWLSQLSPVPFTRDGELSTGAFLSSGIPPIFKMPIEWETNTNFFTGSPIVPQYLEKVSPSEQYDEKTPPVAILAGRALGVSPMKLAHAINGLLGSSSNYLLNPADILGSSVQRFVRDSGGQKRQQAWDLKAEAEVGYNTTRISVRRAVESGDLKTAQSIADGWNKKANEIVPQIVPYIMQDDPKEAMGLLQKVTFNADDLRRLIKTTTPGGQPQKQTLPKGNEPIKNLLLKGVPNPIAPEQPESSGQTQSMGSMFPASKMSNDIKQFLLK